MTRPGVLIGTSGWQYRHWRGGLYPPGVPAREWLEAYAASFATVEVNATFYRLPSEAAVARWAAATPDDFTFVLKASRYLTHVRRLREPEEPVARLVAVARPLGDRLAAVLLQLPPGMPADPVALARTLRAFPRGLRLAVEPRDPRWWTDEVRAVLEDHGAALCRADREGPVGPDWVTAPWVYVRLHAGGGDPSPCYTAAEIDGWADRIAAGGREALVFFNNDIAGCAPRDAAVLARCLDERGVPRSRVPAEASLPA